MKKKNTKKVAAVKPKAKNDRESIMDALIDVLACITRDAMYVQCVLQAAKDGKLEVKDK